MTTLTTLIILGILVIFILLLILLVTHAISIKMNYLNNDEEQIQTQNTPEFQAGVNHAFSLIQISLYKMWSEQELLDFDSINDNIKNNILTITKNQENFKTWHNKYIEHLQNKKLGESNDT